MADDTQDPVALKARLWRELDKEPFGMLGLVGDRPHHFQPMACYPDEGRGSIWFFTKTSTDLVRDAGAGHAAMFILQAKDREFQACVGGKLVEDFDRERLEKYWNPVISAWFPDGKDDPELTMLRLDADDARVWASKRGPVKFGWEIAKANATHSQPDVGGKADLKL